MIDFKRKKKKQQQQTRLLQYSISEQHLSQVALEYSMAKEWQNCYCLGDVIRMDKKKTPHFWISLWIVLPLWNLHSKFQQCAESRGRSEYRKWCKYPISFLIYLTWDFWSYFPKGGPITPQRLMLILWVHWLLSTQYTMDEALQKQTCRLGWLVSSACSLQTSTSEILSALQYRVSLFSSSCKVFV